MIRAAPYNDKGLEFVDPDYSQGAPLDEKDTSNFADFNESRYAPVCHRRTR